MNNPPLDTTSYPPHTYDVAEGVKMLDELEEQQKLDEFVKKAEELIEERDPRNQNYFMRVDTKTIIKTEKEFLYCQENGVQLKVVPYSHAVQLIKEEDSRQKAKAKKRKNQKTTKKARRRNR